MNKTRMLFLCLITVLSVVITASGCSFHKKSAQSEIYTYSDETLGQLLAATYQEGTFIFEGLPWLISKQEVIDKQKLIQSDDDDWLIVEGTFPLNASIKQTVIYNFQDDQLVSGEYRFATSDNNRFAELGKELGALLSKWLPKPRTENIEILDQADISAQQGNNLLWQGVDRSSMKVSLSVTGQEDYLLLMHVASPLPEREGLKK